MEIKKIKIAHPLIEYSISVSHVTPRKSTAFEWLLLEALTKAEGTQFQQENMADFFRTYFQIENPDALLKPVLTKLHHTLNVVSCASLTDATTLTELLLKDVKILPLGKEMQRKGLLPGEQSDDTLKTLYDVMQKKALDVKNLPEQADGIYVPFEEPSFPEHEIREYIESKRMKSKSAAKKKKKKFDWLEPDTEIVSVKPTEEKTVFYNFESQIQLTDGLVWKIENNQDVESEKEVLRQFQNDVPDALAHVPKTSVTKPDEEMEKVILIENLQKEIDLYVSAAKGETFIINRNFFNENTLAQENKEKTGSAKIEIVPEAETLSSNINNGTLIISIPERLLADNQLLMMRNFQVIAERFPVQAEDMRRELTFAYRPKNKKPDMKGIIQRIVEKYCMREPAMLFLLNEFNGLKNEFDGYFEKLISECVSLQDKAGKIEEMNQLGIELLGKAHIPDDIISKFIIDKKRIENSVTNISTAKATLTEYWPIAVVKNQVLRDLMELVLQHTAQSDSLEEIWEFLDVIEQKAPEERKRLDNKEYVRKLYSPRALSDYFKRAFDEMENTPHSKLEENILKLVRIYQDIRELLDVSIQSSNEDIQNALQKCSDNDKKKLKDKMNSWKGIYKNFSRQCAGISDGERYNEFVKKIRTQNAEAKKTREK